MRRLTLYFLAVAALLAGGCATAGKPLADTSFSISDVAVAMKPGATDRSGEQITQEMVESVRTSALQEARANGKTGPAKRLEVTIVRFQVPSRAGSLVSQDQKRVWSDVRVVDMATGADEGHYFSHVEAPMNIWTSDAEQKAGFEIAQGAGVEIVKDAYKAGRKPAGQQ